MNTQRKYTVEYIHPHAGTIKAPFGPTVCEIADGAFSDRNALAAALRAAGVLCKGARLTGFRAEGNRTIAFPRVPGLTTYWHSVTITPVD